jgi:hypothetical protein
MLVLAALTLSLHVQQTSFDILDGAAIEVAVHNSANGPVDVPFEKPAEYEIDITRNGNVIWSNQTAAPPGATFPIHRRHFLPGPSVLVVYVWNGIGTNGDAPSPGTYAVTARLLGKNVTPSASTTLRLGQPLPVTGVAHVRKGDVVTIAGTLDATKQFLTDATGTIQLARRIVTAPNTPIAVRGYLTLLAGRVNAFYIQRWAPMQ